MCTSTNKSLINALNAWTNLAKCDIINMSSEELLELINMTKQEIKEQKILKEHIENFYHIWQTIKVFI